MRGTSKIILPLITATVITTVLIFGFATYFFFNYSKDVETRILKNIEEYNEIDLHHLCNITSCNGIFFNDKFYGIDEETQLLSFQYVENIIFPDEVFRYNNISLRADLSFVIPLLPEDSTSTAYFFVDIGKFIPTFIIFYFIILVFLFIVVSIVIYNIQKKEKVLHDIASAHDKSNLQFSNLMFYIENINHEVNSPLFVLSRTIRELNNKIDGEQETFKIIAESIEQINAVMQRTREVKRINKSSEDRTIYDLIESTITTISIMRSEHIITNMDLSLNEYYLDQKYLTNGTFINILTNHIKNSIEAYSEILTISFVSMQKNKLKFTFQDDGNGIEEKNRKHIFDRGFSTKGTKIERGSGLSINKDIIESCGGEITLMNSSSGTIFEITLPIKIKTDGL